MRIALRRSLRTFSRALFKGAVDAFTRQLENDFPPTPGLPLHPYRAATQWLCRNAQPYPQIYDNRSAEEVEHLCTALLERSERWAPTGMLHSQHAPAALNRRQAEHLLSPVGMSMQQVSSQGPPTHCRFSSTFLCSVVTGLARPRGKIANKDMIKSFMV